jgi:hypothetical protein
VGMLCMIGEDFDLGDGDFAPASHHRILGHCCPHIAGLRSMLLKRIVRIILLGSSLVIRASVRGNIQRHNFYWKDVAVANSDSYITKCYWPLKVPVSLDYLDFITRLYAQKPLIR